MALEIERKFLVKDDSYKSVAYAARHIRQGYLTRRPEGTVRIRVADEKAWITVKGKNKGDTRLEFEYPVPYADGVQMLALCEGGILEKTRYLVEYHGYTWEVDEFHASREGLTVAEVELKSTSDTPDLPPFIGEEVTGNPRYYNSSL